MILFICDRVEGPLRNPGPSYLCWTEGPFCGPTPSPKSSLLSSHPNIRPYTAWKTWCTHNSYMNMMVNHNLGCHTMRKYCYGGFLFVISRACIHVYDYGVLIGLSVGCNEEGNCPYIRRGRAKLLLYICMYVIFSHFARVPFKCET